MAPIAAKLKDVSDSLVDDEVRDTKKLLRATFLFLLVTVSEHGGDALKFRQ